VKGAWPFALGAICGVALMAIPKMAAHLHGASLWMHNVAGSGGGAHAHTEEKFEFTAKGPMNAVAPLFGADKERVWAPDWNPQFVHPSPGADQQGMVFTVAHGHLNAAWVNTEFDIRNGRFQYVYLIPNTLVTVISIQLLPIGEQTRVNVEYDRTALSTEADEQVLHMAKGDRSSGPDWEKQINRYLEKIPSQ
jgi:hypothetical protein